MPPAHYGGQARPTEASKKPRCNAAIEKGMDPEKWWGKKLQDALNTHNIKPMWWCWTPQTTLDMYELEVQQGYDAPELPH